MKIAHVATFLQGGAAIAAQRLHAGLLAAGVDSHFYGLFGQAPDTTFTVWGGAGPGWGARAWLKARDAFLLRPALTGRPGGLEPFGHAVAPLPIRPVFAEAPDVLHLHWVAGLDVRAILRSVPAATPVVWTLHDMQPMTGGCHYAMECDRFAATCRRCPQLAPNDPLDLAAHSWSAKRNWLVGRDLHVVADSHWLEGEARRSTLLRGATSLRTIHYGLDLGAFAPRDRQSCRQALGLGEAEFVVGFAADAIGNRRKGLGDLLTAVGRLGPGRAVRLLSFGAGTARDYRTIVAHTHLGYLTAPELQALAYGALDVFVAPSLAEAFGQTALEAAACGRPVVAYAAGGLRDAVDDGVTGLLVPVGRTTELITALERLRQDPALADELGRAGRARAVSGFSLAHQAQAYERVYEQALARSVQEIPHAYVTTA